LRARTRRVVDRRVLVAPDALAGFPLQGEELYVDLDVMPGHLLLVAVGVDCPSADPVREPIEPVAGDVPLAVDLRAWEAAVPGIYAALG